MKLEEIATLKDLERMKQEIIEEMRKNSAPPKNDKWLTAKEVCKLLNFSRGTLHNRIKKGLITPERRFGGLHFDRDFLFPPS
jgi:hypothetical protein